MNTTRREFLLKSGLAAIGLNSIPLNADYNHILSSTSAQKNNIDLAKDEDFWRIVSKGYTKNASFINLENGYYSLLSDSLLRAQESNCREVNKAGSYYMRKKLYEDRNLIRAELAKFCNTQPQELAFVRNTTEAMNILLLGCRLQGDEEILYNVQDYFSMKDAIKYREKRFGTKIRMLDLPLHEMSDEQIIDAYDKAISPKTKVLLLTHMINVTGQIIPVEKIATKAKAKGVMVFCDAAQSFAQVDFKITALGCEFVATSLHKWLGAPLGTGVLYIKKGSADQIHPLIGCTSYVDDDIRKFEYFGTAPEHSFLSILDAIKSYQVLGTPRIEARLRYLKNYWVDQIKDLPECRILTPLDASRSCAITTIKADQIEPTDLERQLFDNHRVYISSINYQGVVGNRITPHIHTTIEELDVFANALRQLCR